MNVIVGLGYFGSIISSKLKKDDTITIDPVNPKATYKSIDDVPFNDGYWFVTTPASTHYKVIKQLLKKGVENIWVEKPLCLKLEETQEILKDKSDIYCDYTWLKHPMVRAIKNVGKINHLNMKWLNDGSHIPQDVSIVSDLVIHPLSIVVDLMNDVSKHDIIFKNDTTVIVTGTCVYGGTFTIEVSNDSPYKYRSLSAYTENTSYRWSSDKPYKVSNIGKLDELDAIEENIKAFKNNEINKDISKLLDDINKSCQ